MRQLNYQKALRIFILCLCLPAFWLGLSPVHEVHAQSSDQIYIVRPGETLSVIAARYGISYLQLARYNGIANPNLIRSGQRLRIPSRTSAPITVVAPPSVNRPPATEQPPATTRSLPSPAACRGEVSYTVRRGDSLSGIAIYYNITVSALKARNNLPSSLILVGQRLIIPSTC
jgi:LysM repeat protein